jgi:hypothetical protein
MNIEQLIESLKSQGLVSEAEIDAKVAEYKSQSPVNALIVNAKSADQKYTELVADESATLDEVKSAKLAQLDEACSIAIVGGFNYTIGTQNYLFSCSLSAQANFQGTDTLFKDGTITQAEWTVVNKSTGAIERIILDNATFNAIKLEVFKHINSNVSKLRNTLQPQVEGAISKEEVDVIAW